MQTLGSSKAPDAFRTISEVAEDLDIPQHVLRFWETKFTAIRPLKRAGGRRYYRPDDVDLLKGIRLLLYGKGYTIKGVQRILKEDGPRVIQQVGRDGLDASPSPARQSFIQEDEPEELVDADASMPAAYPANIRWEEPQAPLAEDRRGYAPLLQPSVLPADPPSTDRLRAVLADLYECRRILSATKSG